jgi:hypothetical protein
MPVAAHDKYWLCAMTTNVRFGWIDDYSRDLRLAKWCSMINLRLICAAKT